MHPNLPTSCPPLPMSTLQYRQASKCTEERRDHINTPAIAVKKVKTISKQPEPIVKLEEAPIVVVARRVELRRRLTRLREDLQAAERLRNSLQEDIDDIERQLASQSKRARQ